MKNYQVVGFYTSDWPSQETRWAVVEVTPLEKPDKWLGTYATNAEAAKVAQQLRTKEGKI